MSIFKKVGKWIGNSAKKFLGKNYSVAPGDIKLGLGVPTPDIDYGFLSGKGTLDNPIVIEDISVSPPKRQNGGGTKNWLDKAIDGVNAVSNLTNSITGNNKSGKSLAESTNGFLKDATDGLSVQTGIDRNTKIFIGLITGGVVLYLMNSKKRFN